MSKRHRGDILINTQSFYFSSIYVVRIIRTTCTTVLLGLILTHASSHAAPTHSKTKKTQQQLAVKPLTKEEQKHKNMVHRVAKDVGVDPALLMAVVKVESNFDQHASNPNGPMGLMQITHTTAKTVTPNISRRELMLPEKNLRVGALHLKQLLREFGDPKLALAAYQAGAGKVKAKGHHVLGNPHTAKHVNKVMNHYHHYRGHAETSNRSALSPLKKVSLKRGK